MIFPSNHHLNHHLKSMKLDLSWLYPVTAIIWAVINLAHAGEKGTELFREYTQSSWMNQINQQAEATSQNPEPIANQVPNLMLEKPSDSHHRQKLEDYYQNEDFDGLQSFGEQRALQLDTEQSPEGEAWRLLNQSPDRYYPDANEHRILGAMELGVKALEHPNTWSKQKDWPTDAKGQPIYDQNSEMSATIARMRQHFKGCDYQKKLILKKDRQVHSPDLKECTRALVTDDSVILHRKITLNPFLEYLSGSGLSGLSACERNSINEQSAGEGCLQIRLGEGPHGDNYYHCGCCIKEENLTVNLLKPEALTQAVFQQARWDDRMQFWLNDKKLWQSNDDFPPETGSRCERNKNVYLDSPVIIEPSLLQKFQDPITFKIRTSVGDEGEGYALIKLFFNATNLLIEDRWSPDSALEKLTAMQQWHQDGLCRLTFQCLETFTEAEYSVHGKVIPLQSTLYPQLSADCKTVRAESDCFYYKTKGRHDSINHCSQYANDPNCQFLDSRCLGSSPSQNAHTCYTREERYDCGYTGKIKHIGIEESIHCEGQPMQCMLGECKAEVTDTDNSYFASAVSGLHAAKHLAHDMQCGTSGQSSEYNSGCRIFSGTAYTCKKGIFNLVDCCNLPTQVNFGSYMNLLLMGYLFDKSSVNLQSNYPNQLTGQYRKMREPLIRGINTLSQPAKNLWSDGTSFIGKSWDKLTEKLWPTPAEVHVRTATAKPIAGELSQKAQASMLGTMQQQLMRKMADVVQKVLGEDATNLLFRTTGNTLRAISFGTNFLCLANYSAHKSTKISLISCTSQKFSF